MWKKRWICLLLGLFFFSQVQGEEIPRKTICLNMIVKNEKKVIQRCLDSLKDKIDYWVIVDTGSEDGTQRLIQEVMKGIPGELHERPWVDFGFNRREALALTKGKADYVLFMDADERLIYSEAFEKFPVEKDFYYIPVRNSSPEFVAYHRFFLVNNKLDWQWQDILHEYLEIPKEAKTQETLDSVICFTDSDGFRADDPKKYYKDAAILEKALEKDPLNSRYVFYLAQSYFNAKEYELAIEKYEKRASMVGGWDQEVFWSLYAAATIRKKLLKSPELFITNYCKAYQLDPTRAEPLFRLAEYFNSKGDFLLGYLLSSQAVTLSLPQGTMYVQAWIYEYGALCSFAYSAMRLEKYEESCQAWLQVLDKKNTPDTVRIQARKYLFWIDSKKDKLLK